MKLDPSKKQIYDNIKMLSCEGILLCTIYKKKADFYLNKRIADKIDDKTIKLKFQTNGRGKQGIPYYLSYLPNMCVACGAEKKLTKHHIFPECFKKGLPDYLKRYNHYDVVVLCIECHGIYEKQAAKFRNSLPNQIWDERKIDKKLIQAKAAAAALKNHKHKIPENKKQELIDRISNYLGRAAGPLDIEEMFKLKVEMGYKRRNFKAEIENILVKGELNEFVYMWRKHFVDVLKPRFLHPLWDINKKYTEL